MLRKTTLLVVTICFGAALAAYADWDPSMPSKWVQMPDETPLGLDVNVWFPLVDDFECRQTGPIIEIHIWGSWYDDYIPGGDPEGVTFFLSIHEDIPADESPTGYSMPGDTLWTRRFHVGEFTARPRIEGIREGWMDPPDSTYYAGSDTTI